MNYRNKIIYEHEIPDGSKLYFGNSAKLKRDIENRASAILEKYGFSEIITPYFSYHQHLSVAPQKLLRFSDSTNHEISLRADSTVDVVRIATKRLKDMSTKKWFYIQPVFKYPSSEIYQIGAEILDSNDLLKCINIAAELFDELHIKPHLQISNIEIPKIICKLLDLPISVFENGRLELILNQNLNWLNRLANIKNDKDIDEVIKIVPSELREPLNSIKDLASGYENRVYAPLYYSKMRYYDKLFFRFLCDNYILSGGGSYEIDGKVSVGFAIFSDALIENLSK
ncbi:ATP phosphoribosyltransferase regulatory subunit [Campylobacter fetus]|uniref:ATP phosphoribosyltransferase regulatory subunit n=1 Tax=Campylobacter fetus TaxID=196 RepID=UPI000FCB261D|nr:ATP phosphoribosyltransferase regulatory subunit [Campylobacter fetus]QQF52889.1 ATP phosphoribosyltransferase regulatory subunit [Campylobacter fetus subsp. venerealis]RUT49951.1 ATP phosphoribosyltransferase regulatory subunit [Campylobacter fetus]RUT50212.1 ATP phosphoribosyltransferase regulatory subunit [Campylobacter fetus]